mgnify:FL=1
MKLSDLQRAYPPLPADILEDLTHTARNLKEENPVKRKLSVVLAAAMLLVGITTALALTLRHSVEPFVPAKFADKITAIDDHYENDYFTMSINDAISDGTHMMLAMQFEPKPGAEEVLVFPVLTARHGDTRLFPDPEAGFEYLDGFWQPDRLDNPDGIVRATLDMVLLEEDVANLVAVKEDINWTLTLHTLKPLWPVELDTHTLIGDREGDGLNYEEYAQLFKDAYQEKRILLAEGDNTYAFDAYLPVPEHMTEEEFIYKRNWERLVLSGAFTEVDRAERTFTTPGNEEVKRAVPGEPIRLEGFDVIVQDVQVAFLRSHYDFLLRPRDGTDFSASSNDPLRYFEIRVDGKALELGGFSLNPDDLSVPGVSAQRLRGDFSIASLDEVPTALTFVPFSLKEGAHYLEARTDLSLRVYDDQGAFVVNLE